MTSRAQKRRGYKLPSPVIPSATTCVKLTIPDADEYRNAIKTHLMELGNWWTWEKSYTPSDTRAKEAGEIWRDKLYRTLTIGTCDEGTDMPYLLRQSPTNKYHLQQSTDNGATWTLAYDYSYLKRTYNTLELNTYNTTTQATYNSNYTTYAGNILNVAPNFSNQTNSKNKLLYWMLRDLIGDICKSIVEVKEQGQAQDQTTAQIGGAILAGIATITGAVATVVTGGALLAFASITGALAFSSVVATSASLIDTLDVSLFKNQSTQDELACLAYKALKPLTPPTFSAFNTCLDASNRILSADAETLRTAVRPFFQNIDIFIALFKDMNSVYDVASMLPDVPCDTWSHTFDFLTSNGGWFGWGNNTNAGQYDSTGWRRGTADGGRFLQLNRYFANSVIKKIVVGFNEPCNVPSGGSYQNRIIARHDVTGASLTTFTNGLTSWEWNGNETLDGIGINIETGSKYISLPSTLRITSVYFEGEGVNPFI